MAIMLRCWEFNLADERGRWPRKFGASPAWRRLQRQVDNPVSEFISLLAKPGDPEFLDGISGRQKLRNQNHARRLAAPQEAVEMPRHGFQVVRHQYPAEAGGQSQHIRIRSGIADQPFFERGAGKMSICGSVRRTALKRTLDCGGHEFRAPSRPDREGSTCGLPPRRESPPSDKLRPHGSGP